MKIAVFVSGRGSNLKALLDNVPLAKMQVVAVISDKSECAAFNIAREHNIETVSVSNVLKDSYILYSSLIEKLKAYEVELIVLAGFLKKIPDELVDAFNNRIINIHPALLPLYGGKGMYGLNVHSAVFNAGAEVSGATVHLVDKVYDNGFIIAQREVDIKDAKSPEDIAGRVLKIEHELLPYVVEKFADGKILIEKNRIEILD